MSEKDEETFKSVDLEQKTEKSPEPDINPQESPSETKTDTPSTPSTEAKAESTPSTHTSAAKVKWASSVEQFKLKRFFVLRVISLLFEVSLKPQFSGLTTNWCSTVLVIYVSFVC